MPDSLLGLLSNLAAAQMAAALGRLIDDSHRHDVDLEDRFDGLLDLFFVGAPVDLESVLVEIAQIGHLFGQQRALQHVIDLHRYHSSVARPSPPAPLPSPTTGEGG